MEERQEPWTIGESEKLYRIREWGQPYFFINAAGHIAVAPQGDRARSVDLYELVQALQQRNIELPLLIRFPDILGDRIQRLSACFARAIARYNYPNIYQGVYPVKCNQQRHLVEALVQCGRPYQLGLEVGSKPELMIALATLKPQHPENQQEPLLICNGYKDREYLETALLANRLGHTPIVVIEQLEELDWTLRISNRLGISPVLGIRAKLSSKGAGHWQDSSGDRAKFGLAAPEILRVIRQLAQQEMLHCLQLLHFHIGSQVSAIGTIKDAIREAAQIYGELVVLGAKMKYLDVGGGLAIDYDGSKTNFHASKNYNMQNYANDIVAAVQEACEARNIQAPILVSESGRAIATHQAILVFDILSTSEPSAQLPQPRSEREQEHLLFRSLWETYESIALENYQEAYHDAIQCKEEANSLFNFGYLSLEERARIEQLYWACCQKIFQITCQQEYVPEDLEDLEANLASIYYANLSVFRSIPDSWSIDQLFPVLPIHRLGEEPTKRGILADLTCDSDGTIDRFIDLIDVKTLLELHPLLQRDSDDCLNSIATKPYYLGLFLIGAYQEIMGSIHNLFGSVNVVHIRLNSKGYQVEQVVRGDTILDVLRDVQYDAEDLVETIRRLTEEALQENRITLEESQWLLQNYERNLGSYTYLSHVLNR